MRLDLGTPVHCSDAEFGKLADIVIDPTTRRVTHLVAAPEHRDEESRLIPIELAREDDGCVRLDCTLEQAGEFDRVDEVAYLRLGEFPVEDARWDVGITEMLALPFYDTMEDPGLAMATYDGGVTVRYDRVPKGEVEIRRSSPVISSDGRQLGHVEGFVVAGEQHVGHIVLEHGHLWGKREVAIPIGAVAEVKTDGVVLSLSHDEVDALDAVRVHRWHHHTR
jgi:sporulation protein YlmC with PRC-barrel domain